MEYDLEGRTRDFSKAVLRVVRATRIRELNRNIVAQLLRSATSVGANYCEANAASSRKDFRNKIFICRKEIQETKYWIELLADVEQEKRDALRNLWSQAHELTLIFSKISSSLRKIENKN